MLYSDYAPSFGAPSYLAEASKQETTKTAYPPIGTCHGGHRAYHDTSAGMGIWINKQTEGVSSTSWILYLFAAVIWLLYGLQLKDKPLIISSILWLVMESAVVAGTVLYG